LSLRLSCSLWVLSEEFLDYIGADTDGALRRLHGWKFS
jgi:hypothetical protein